MINLFQRKLTNKSIAFLESFREAVELNSEVNDLIAALYHAKLIQYASRTGMGERFGVRKKKSDLISLAMQVINGMASEIEILKAEIAYHKSNQETLS